MEIQLSNYKIQTCVIVMRMFLNSSVKFLCHQGVVAGCTTMVTLKQS